MHGFGGSPMHLQWVEVECSLRSLMYLMSKCKIVLAKHFLSPIIKKQSLKCFGIFSYQAPSL